MVRQEHRAYVQSDLQPHLFTVEQYEQICMTGIVPYDARTELIEGMVITLPAIGEDHLWNVNFVTHVFFRRFDGRAIVIQAAVGL